MATSEEGSTILQLGTHIKPNVDDHGVKHLVTRLYGLSVASVKELNSYDDRNFRIIEVSENQTSPHGFILKIVNSMDSKDVIFFEAQNEILLFLSKRGIKCPTPVRNVKGNYIAKEVLAGKSHLIRLLHYQPGELILNVPHTDDLLYQVGVYAANLDEIMKDFHHEGLKNRRSIWMLEKFPEVERFKYVIEDKEQLEIFNEILEEFKNVVEPKLNSLARGVIHGDLNEQNILVKKVIDSSDNVDYTMAAVIDFGDMHESCYLIELALSMAHMALVTRRLDQIGLIMAGYNSVRQLTPDECSILKTCISARLAQSVVLGLYTHKLEPTNMYVLSSQKPAWELLKKMRSEKSISNIWRKIAEEYLDKRKFDKRETHKDFF